MPEIGELARLAVKHGSDKWGTHSYCRHYERHFQPFRDRAFTLFEIGVGGYHDPESGGASLRMWAEYFPWARIYALDIHDKTPHANHRVRIFRGDQADAELLRRISDEAGGFDIVIDDGSHLNRDVIATFGVLFPLLKPDGLYVVEDTQTSYWPAMGGSTRNPDDPRATMGFFKGLVHGLNHPEFVEPLAPASIYDRTVLGLHFYHNLVLVQKGDNIEPSNIAEDDPLRRA